MKTFINKSGTVLRFQNAGEEKIIPPGEQAELEINNYIQGLIDQGIVKEVKSSESVLKPSIGKK